MSRRANGQGTIYRRKDGRWESTLQLPDGKKSFYGRTQQDVAAKLNAALANQQAGLPPSDSSQTVQQFLETWLQSVRRSVRPKTWEAYDLNVRRLQPVLGSYRLKSLTPQLIEGAYNELLERLSRRSVEQVHTVFHRALGQALRWGLLGRNPTDAVNVPRPERREMKWLSSEEAIRLLESTREDRLHALWVTLVMTGMRLGEALGLRWDDIDFDRGTVRIQRALQRQKGAGLVFVEPKTAKSRRTLVLPGETLKVLREHRVRQAEEQLMAPTWDDSGLVFTRPDGTGIESSSVTHHFRRALKKAELPLCRVHDLRHTAASLLLADGVSYKLVADMLGHSTVMLTLDIYSHVSPGMQAQAAASMDRLLGR